MKIVSGEDPRGGRRPDPDKVFSSGNITGGGMAEIDEGAAADTAASSTRTVTGGNSSSAAGEDETALSRSRNTDGGRALKSCGAADRVFAMDTKAGVGRALSVDEEHSVVSKETIGSGSFDGAVATGTAEIPSEP